MLWYYQGREQIWRMASFDIFFKASALAAIFLWVKGPGDEAKALALGAAGWFLSAVVTGAYSLPGSRLPSAHAGPFLERPANGLEHVFVSCGLHPLHFR